MVLVCGGCFLLMDVGVKIFQLVVGIVMGLIIEGVDYVKYVVFSDIFGEEDYFGDMDFKVVGMKEGIIVFQMDIKIVGVLREIMVKVLVQVKEGCMYILDIMMKVIDILCSDFLEYVLKILMMKIDEEKIGVVIGIGGKIIKSIVEQLGLEINIENDGMVIIYGKNSLSVNKVFDLVKFIVEEFEVGDV